MAYPDDLPNFTDPQPTDDVSVVGHAEQHQSHNENIEAIEEKLGIDDSADSASIDYKLKNPLSVNPGHKHTAAAITDLDKYTQDETDDLLAGKADSSHTHVAANVTDFNTAADARITAQKGAVNGLATLGSDQKIPQAQLPAIGLVDVYSVASQVAQLALTAEEGDVAIRTDESKTYIHNGGTAGTMADWSQLLSPTGGAVAWGTIIGTLSDQADLQSALDAKQPLDADLTAIAALTPSNDDIVQRKAGAWINRTMAQLKTDLVLAKGDVGLGNVDNTSDANKPVSTAQQTALDGKQPLDSDLTAIAALSPSNDDIIQRKSGSWINRTIAQLKSDLGLTKGDVGLGNVDNVQQLPMSYLDTDASLAADSDAKVASQKAVKAYVDAIAQGLSVKNSVRVATTVAGTLASSFENGDTVDGVVLATGDRILIKNQASGAENGIYVVAASGAPARAQDANTSAEVTSGMFVFVSEGTTNADSGWVLTTNNPITLGSTALSFTQFSGAGQITAGNALTKTGNTLDVAVDGSTIEISGDALQVKDAGITLAKMANMASASLIYRKTGGAGAPEVNTLATLKVDLLLTGTNSGDETATTVGALVNGASAKTTPVDADNVAITDSAASHILKKVTWANIKATLKTYFDTLYLSVSAVTFIMPIPAFPCISVSSTNTSGGGQTTGYFGRVIVLAPITAAKLTFDCAALGIAGVAKIGLFSEDGQTRILNLATASIAAGGLVATAFSGVLINPGVYYIGLVPSGALELQFRGYTLAATTTLANNRASEPVACGTLTVTSGTMPTTINPTALTPSSTACLQFALDN